jgi:hypothetical protein
MSYNVTVCDISQGHSRRSGADLDGSAKGQDATSRFLDQTDAL